MFNKIITMMSISTLLILTGCAMIEKSNATDTEQLLAAAGFTMKLADTPEKQANIAAMTQRKVVAHSKNATVQYAYADAEFCKCIYLGSEQNYQQYQKIAVEKNIARMNEDAELNWGAWGGWRGREYYYY